MNMHLTKSQIGLDGVPAAETVLSHVDGERGELIIAGERVGDLAGKASFESVTARLWSGATGKEFSEANVRASLGAARARAFARLPDLLPATRGLSVVDGFRAAVAGLRAESSLDHEATIVGACPVIVGALVQQAKDHAPIAPDATLSHAADTLRMLHGSAPEARSAVALDTYLVTVCDHSMNASTFTARVIASTQADLVSAITGAIGALKGPLHGGAPGPALAMIEQIGTADRAESWMKAALARGDRLMGFGHRVYKVRDPRAEVLYRAAEALADETGERQALDLAREVERVGVQVLAEAKPGRNLNTNVEFYTALLLRELGLPRDLFSPTFAVGRTAGWTAHVLEQQATGRLIRPQSEYIGPYGLTYVPLEQR